MEGNADEFSARVMNDAKRARVTRKPLVCEMHGNMLRILVVDAIEFDASCRSIDDGECTAGGQKMTALGHGKIEQMVKKFRTHCRALNFERGFVNGILKEINEYTTV